MQKISKFFPKFCIFHQTIKNKIGKKLQILIFDNRGEFPSIEFKKYCATYNIHKGFFKPFTLYQNSVVE
uniref:Integrase catalytic domain-containing protein n=1 Tax=Physcomitrium patens TaxID=3218 RepID=A0A2K1JCB6_PHYPA|nr:hypothetical protein PHYPA_019449 [Physcomitrium patens]